MLGLGTGIVKSNFYVKYLTAIFDGTNDFITVPDDDALSFTSSTGFGISFWINLNEVVSHGVINKDEEYNLYIRNNTTPFNTIQFEWSVKDDSEDKMHIGLLSFTPEDYDGIVNQWVHVFAEYNTSKQAKIFVNNVLGTIGSQSGFVEIENTTGDLLIGKAHSSSSGDNTANVLLSGSITNLCIYSSTLNSTEKSDIINAGVSGNFTDHANNAVIAYYPLTSDLNDISGNNHHGSSAAGEEPIFDLV